MSMNFVGTETQVIQDLQTTLSASIVTIGAFDGVHRGHQHLISTVIAEARAAGIPSVVWTFDPPPKVFFGRAKQLSHIDDKIARIARLGPDFIIVASFCKTYSARSHQDFISDLHTISPQNIHVGQDFRFGRQQIGDVDLLSEHFDVTLAKPVLCPWGEIVSSTRIRTLEAEGQFEKAAILRDCPGTLELLAGRLQSRDKRFQEPVNV